MDRFNVNVAMSGYVGPIEHRSNIMNSPETILEQVETYRAQQLATPALELLHQGIEKYPDSVQLRQRLINIYVETQQADDARREILRLHELGYKDPEFLTMVGTTLAAKRDYPAAIEHFREARSMGAPRTAWLVQFAELLLRTGHAAEAEAVLDYFLRVGERQSVLHTRSRVYLAQAILRVQQRRNREAVDICLKAVLNAKKMKSSPLNNVIFYYLGLAEFRSGNYEKATLAFETYIRIAPSRVAPYRYLERIARKSEDDEQADAYIMKVRQMLEERRLLRYEKRKLASD